MKELTKEYLYKRYIVEKFSMPEISEESGYSYSNIRYHLGKHGIPIRSRKESLNTSRYQKKASGISKKNGAGVYERTEEIRNKQSNAMIELSKKKAKGVSLKPSGYLEITMGEHKGRSLHVVIMELKLGRRLDEDECVHHIDGDKENNSIHNLALMTTKGHARLHRYQDKMSGKNRNRDKRGKYT